MRDIHFLERTLCSETILTGESQLHISTPLGIEPGPSSREANGLTTGPVELCMNATRLQGLHRAPPQQPTMPVVKQEGGHAASVKAGQKSYVNQVGRQPSDGSGQSPPQSRPQ